MLKANFLVGVKFPQKQIPKDLLEAIVANYATSHGCAVFDKDNPDAGIQMITDGDPPTVDVLSRWQHEGEGYKAIPMLLCMGSAEQPLMQADLQPFVMCRDAKDKPVIVAVIQGDFNSISDAASERTAIGLSVDNYIQKKMAKLFTTCNGDVNKVFEELKTDTLLQEELLKDTTRGCITFLGLGLDEQKQPGGIYRTIWKGGEEDKLLDKSWGWFSVNPKKAVSTAPVEAADPPPTTTPSKKRSFGGAGPSVPNVPKNTVVGMSERQKPIKTPQPDTAVVPPKETELQLATGYTVEDGKLYFQCPNGPGFSTKEQIRTATEKGLGGAKYKPQNFMSRPKTEVTDSKILEQFADLIKAAPTAIDDRHPSEMAGDVVDQDDGGGEEYPTAHWAFISSTEKERLTELLCQNDLGFMDRVGKGVPNPNDLPSLETPFPPFHETAGFKDLYDTAHLFPEQLKEIMKNCPNAFFRLFLDWRREAILLKNAASYTTKTQISDNKRTQQHVEAKNIIQSDAASPKGKKRSFG